LPSRLISDGVTAARPPFAPLHVLVADDNEIDRRLATAMDEEKDRCIAAGMDFAI